MLKSEEEEEDRPLLVASNCKVVEYLEPIMSKELLFKFPDNSALDFDYSQSSIWSPLVPRTYYSPMDFDWEENVTPRRLVFGCKPQGSDKKGKRTCFKSVSSSIQKKKRKRSFRMDTSPALDLDMDISKSRPEKKSKANKGASCDLSPFIFKEAKCAPFASKGWKNVLKAASKHFKRKKKDSASHVKLSNYLTHYCN